MFKCFSKLYELSTQYERIYPGTASSFYLFMKQNIEIETAFLNLVNQNEEFVNTMLIIQMAGKEQTEPLGVPPRIFEYVVWISNITELN